MKSTVLVLLLALLIPLTSALQFSPASLQFELGKNEVQCKEINFQISSPATIKDTWAKSPEQPWNLKEFQTSSETLKLNPSYPPTIQPAEEKTKLCIFGSSPGEYKGALIFRQEKVGNSIVQFAVWLKVKIKGEKETSKKEQIVEPITKRSKHSSSSDSSDGDTSGIIWTSFSPTASPQKQPITPEYNAPDREIHLLGGSPSRQTTSLPPFILLIATPIALVVLLALMLSRKPG